MAPCEHAHLHESLLFTCTLSCEFMYFPSCASSCVHTYAGGFSELSLPWGMSPLPQVHTPLVNQGSHLSCGSASDSVSSFYAFKVPGTSGSSTDVNSFLHFYLNNYVSLYLGIPLALCVCFMRSVNWSMFPRYGLGDLSGCPMGSISLRPSLLSA